MTDNPFVKLVEPRKIAGRVGVVILDRVEPGVTPEYCVHGKSTCYTCQEWVWLGDKTYEVVASGRAAPLCLQCAPQVLPQSVRPSERIQDHRRAEGPH